MQKNKVVNICVVLVIIAIMFQTCSAIIAAELPTFAVVDTYKKEESSVSTVAPSFSFKSKSQILMEPITKKILYENNADEHLSPASVTKVMTLLLIMEAIDSGKISYTDKVTCSNKAQSLGGSQIWFKEGEKLSVEEAIKCISVVSANDVSVAMAELLGGSEDNFVNMMNEKAKTLGMKNTSFKNCHGLDQEGHYTTARDIAIMSSELITKHPNILVYTSIWMDSIREGAFLLSSTNKLLKLYEGLNGIKTGSTDKAGFNLSASATKAEMSLIAVVMKAPTGAVRNSEITELLNFGFANYKVINIAKEADVVTKININKSIGKNFNLVYKKDEAFVISKGETLEYKTNVIVDKNIKAPISKKTVAGKVEFIKGDDDVFYEADIIISESAIKSNYFDYLVYVFKTFIPANLTNKIA